MEHTEPVSVTPSEAPREPVPTPEDRVNALAERWSAQLTGRQEALDKRETALRSREMPASIREALEKRGLPASLSACLSFPSKEALEKGVPALEEAFRDAVRQTVEAHLSSSAPKTAPLKALSEMTDEEYYAALAHQ